MDPNGCNENLKLLVRGATNAYFPQVSNVISMPIGADPIGDIIKANLASLSVLANVDQLIDMLSFSPALSSALGKFDPHLLFSRIQGMKNATNPDTPTSRVRTH